MFTVHFLGILYHEMIINRKYIQVCVEASRWEVLKTSLILIITQKGFTSLVFAAIGQETVFTFLQFLLPTCLNLFVHAFSLPYAYASLPYAYSLSYACAFLLQWT